MSDDTGEKLAWAHDSPREHVPARSAREFSSAPLSSDEDDTDSETELRRISRVPRIERGFVLNLFTAINVVCVLVALGVIVAQILVITDISALTAVSITVRCYCMLFCLVIICAEMEWTKAVTQLSVFTYWIPRGILYSFIGMLTLETQDEKNLSGNQKIELYILYAGWIMVFMGVLYFLMGLCCLDQLKRRRLERYRTLLQAKKKGVENYGAA